MKRLPDLLEPWFLFSLIWSVGASCDNDGRNKFSVWLRERFIEEKPSIPIPDEGLVYDYAFDDGGIFDDDEEAKEEDDDQKKKIRDVRKIFEYSKKFHIFCLYLKYI